MNSRWAKARNLKEVQDLREDLSHYSSVVEALYERSREVVPPPAHHVHLHKSKCV